MKKQKINSFISRSILIVSAFCFWLIDRCIFNGYWGLSFIQQLKMAIILLGMMEEAQLQLNTAVGLNTIKLLFLCIRTSQQERLTDINILATERLEN